MYGVDRGPEPNGLGHIRTHFTPNWIRHYRQGVGNPPKDSHWRRFHDELRCAFRGLCGYCEEIARGEVDHFRPKSQFPELVYCWSNWLFACHDCNQAKSNTWPTGGYVDPCATTTRPQPECYFDFDTLTGLVLPHASLNSHRRNKAQRTINALRLNDLHHLKRRVEWLKLLAAALPVAPTGLTSESKRMIAEYASRGSRLSSIVRTWLFERGFPLA